MSDSFKWTKDGPQPHADLTHEYVNRKLYSCHATLQSSFYKIRRAVQKEHRGWSIRCVWGHRSPEQQFAIFKLGRHFVRSDNGGGTWKVKKSGAVRTNADGYRTLSAHNEMPSMAMDLVALTPKGKMDWDNLAIYELIGEVAKSLSLKWGGDWKSKDMGHVYL